MDSVRFEKQTCEVLFTLADGSKLSGEVYLSLVGAHHDGIQRVGELLNGDDRFIPVRTGEGTRMLHLRQLVSAQVAQDDELDELMRLGQRYAVTVQTVLGQAVEAEVYVDLPEGAQRVKDWLNRSEGFLRFFLPEHLLYLNREFITTVRD